MKKISFTLGIILMIILICTSCAHIPSADNGFYFSDYAQEKPNELSEGCLSDRTGETFLRKEGDSFCPD